MLRPDDFKCWWNLLSLHLLLHLKMHLWMIFKIFTSELFNWHLARYQFETFYGCITGPMIFGTNKHFCLISISTTCFLVIAILVLHGFSKRNHEGPFFTKILTQLSLIKKYLFIVVHFNPLYIEGWLFHFPAFIITQL